MRQNGGYVFLDLKDEKISGSDVTLKNFTLNDFNNIIKLGKRIYIMNFTEAFDKYSYIPTMIYSKDTGDINLKYFIMFSIIKYNDATLKTTIEYYKIGIKYGEIHLELIKEVN